MQEQKVRNLERWFQLLTALMGGGRPTAADLADRFGVSQRTIFRDVAALEEIGIPVVREDGCYSVMDTYRIKPIQFNSEEVLTLAVALDFARRQKALSGSTAATTAMEKLVAVMPSNHREIVAGLDDRLVVDPIQSYALPGAPGLERLLQSAMQGSHPVRIRYRGLTAAAPSERTVHPYGLAYRGTALYLIGHCELRGHLRTFHVNRIESAEIQPALFDRPADFDLEEYLGQIWGLEEGPEMDVQVRFMPTVAVLARETVWHPSQTIIEEEDGAVLLSLRTRGKSELARWLAGYGGHVQVLEPPELREAVVALGRAIVRCYE